MKKTKPVALLLIIAIVTMLFSGCTSPSETPASEPAESVADTETQEPAEEEPAGDVQDVYIFQYKVDTVDQMQNLANMYTDTIEGYNFIVETVGGSSDSNVALQQRAAADEFPDLVALGAMRLPEWREYLLDLSDEPWVGNLLPNIDELFRLDGQLYAQPLTVEAYGFIYNKDLFEQAGIEAAPTTMTELVAVCEQLESAGITPFVTGWKEGWILGQHYFSTAFSSTIDDPTAFYQGVGSTTAYADHPESFQKAMDLIQLTVDYGMPNLVAMDYTNSLSNFATGQAAITFHGVWTQPTLDEMNPGMNIGTFGFIMDDSEETNIVPYGTDGGWCIYNESEHIDVLKGFLTWMAQSTDAHTSLVEDFKFMLPFESEVDDTTLGSVFAGFNEFKDRGDIQGWFFPYYAGGIQDDYAVPLQEFIAGQKTAEEVMVAMDEIAVEYATE